MLQSPQFGKNTRGEFSSSYALGQDHSSGNYQKLLGVVLLTIENVLWLDVPDTCSTEQQATVSISHDAQTRGTRRRGSGRPRTSETHCPQGVPPCLQQASLGAEGDPIRLPIAAAHRTFTYMQSGSLRRWQAKQIRSTALGHSRFGGSDDKCCVH